MWSSRSCFEDGSYKDRHLSCSFFSLKVTTIFHVGANQTFQLSAECFLSCLQQEHHHLPNDVGAGLPTLRWVN